MAVQVTVVGCAGSFPGPDSAASCYLIDAGGYKIVMDLGSGAVGALQRYAGLYEIDAVVLSHQHSDHCLDMCGYCVARVHHPEGPRPRIPVYGPAGMGDRLARAHGLDPGHGMAEAFDFITLEPGTRQIGPVRVTARHMSHPVETFGFRLEHGGKTLAYSADTGPTEQLVQLAEASFLDGPDLPPNLHLTAGQAGEHAARAGVGELVLTHLVAWNDKAPSMEQAAATFAGTLSVATTGRQLLH
jgi:ribonuclease BN (tRNA processing enzyme)